MPGQPNVRDDVEELSLHILDIVHNSIEAGATRIDVEIVEATADDRLRIRVTDNGRGMDPELLRRVLDPFVTSRTTRRVGLGLSLLSEVAEACDGKVAVESTLGQGTVVTADFQASHIDRPPLGDLQSTLLVIAAAEEIDFRYRHEVDGRVFAFSTAEMRRLLGDVPLTHPAALRWLETFLERGLRRLRKRVAPGVAARRAKISSKRG